VTRRSVSLGLWLDRPPAEVLRTAVAADACGYPELWIGEMATFDAFALATAVGREARRISLTVGPLAVTVRDPVMLVMGAASVTELTGRRCGIGLGTSSATVVEAWHGRSRRRSAQALEESATACRQLLDGHRATVEGEVLRTSGYRLRLPPPGGPLTVAAFGPAAIGVAARCSDRMVANLVSAEQITTLRTALQDAATEAGRPDCPPLAVWVPAAVDPTATAMEQLRRAIVGYLGAPGYAEMFERSGGGRAVALAREGAHPREQLAAVTDELISTVSAVGSRDEVERRLEAYARAGADEVVLVPAATDDDPAGARTLEALAP
jgi:probable F420-dependent oxidoreductase